MDKVLNIDVHTRGGTAARITRIRYNRGKNKITYVYVEPPLGSLQSSSGGMENAYSTYTADDIIKLLEAASKAAQKYTWPREYRLLFATIPLALIIYFLGWWTFNPILLAVISLLPLLKKRPRTKIDRRAIRALPSTALVATIQPEGAAAALISRGSVLDKLSRFEGKGGVYWVTEECIMFFHPDFWTA